LTIRFTLTFTIQTIPLRSIDTLSLERHELVVC